MTLQWPYAAPDGTMIKRAGEAYFGGDYEGFKWWDVWASPSTCKKMAMLTMNGKRRGPNRFEAIMLATFEIRGTVYIPPPPDALANNPFVMLARYPFGGDAMIYIDADPAQFLENTP